MGEFKNNYKLKLYDQIPKNLFFFKKKKRFFLKKIFLNTNELKFS